MCSGTKMLSHDITVSPTILQSTIASRPETSAVRTTQGLTKDIQSAEEKLEKKSWVALSLKAYAAMLSFHHLQGPLSQDLSQQHLCLSLVLGPTSWERLFAPHLSYLNSAASVTWYYFWLKQNVKFWVFFLLKSISRTKLLHEAVNYCSHHLSIIIIESLLRQWCDTEVPLPWIQKSSPLGKMVAPHDLYEHAHSRPRMSPYW